MNNKILFITVFISNIAFGAVITLPSRLEVSTTKESKSLACQSAKQLQNNGLEQDIAKEKVRASLQDNLASNETMAQNILTSIKSLKESDIISFISQSSLKGEKVDFSSYETLISLVQQKSQLLLDKELLSKIENLSILNQQVKKSGVII